MDTSVHSDESLLIEEFDLKGEEARMMAFLGTQKSSPVHRDATGRVNNSRVSFTFVVWCSFSYLFEGLGAKSAGNGEEAFGSIESSKSALLRSCSFF